MPLFQKSVINKYLQQLNSAELDNSYKKFLRFYGDIERIDNIRLLKEENYQEGFLREIFVDVLGYTINPDKNYNLTTEFRNETNSKKADGAMLEEGKAIGVIELKSTKTPHLESIKEQAFSYKNNQSNCRYVITSNFEKLRFYIDNATEWEEFNLFEMDFERFKIFYLFLCSANIFNGTTAKLKKESLLHEENVTDSLYKDYSKFKKDIFENLIKNNPGKNKLQLFHKSQKLLDRILFVLFAEDSGLVPPNAISRIIEQWKTFKELDEPVSLYSRFVKLFGHLDTGHKYENWEIPAYNGGLFRKDELLDNLIIDDDILEKQSLKLSNYDFNTEVDVNILGHIFEHSISEIEQVAAEIEGTEAEKEKSRRKKEGIFYTPKYITKYIVENTVGALCNEKKKELEIDFIENEIIENSRTAKGKLTVKAKELLERLDKYREYLLSLKILDPACGSGAFLNQALEFLINEHEMLDDYKNEILKESFVVPDVSKSILENNLYGVDINEEAVEIAKLSLWLRTAEKGRKLSDLNSNIKCGNSLIDDPEVAGEKAFNWEKEFPEIMISGGFDVVIGNPPYVRAELLGKFKNYFEKNFKVYNSGTDLFGYFYEHSFNLLKKKGIFGFISNTFDKTTSGIALRKYLKGNVLFDKYVDFTDFRVFEDVTTYPIILIFRKEEIRNKKYQYYKIPKDFNPVTNNIINCNYSELSQTKLDENNWSFANDKSQNILNKLMSYKTIRELLGKTYYGVKTALNEAFIVPKNTFNTSNRIKPIYEGKDINKWYTLPTDEDFILFESGWTKQTYGKNITEGKARERISKDFPEIFKHLLKFEERAKKRYDQGEFWWELRNCAYYELFEKPKIIFPNLQNSNKFCFDDKGTYINAPAVFIPTDDLSILAILNSRIVWYFLKSICVIRNGGYIEVKPQYFEQIPIPEYSEKKRIDLEAISNKIISDNKLEQGRIRVFLSRITTNFPIEKPTNKLKEFYNYDFKTFLAELKKKKITLSLKQQEEWQEYFNEHIKEINSLQETIARTDKEIDSMVYELYGLTDEEIMIVEESVG